MRVVSTKLEICRDRAAIEVVAPLFFNGARAFLFEMLRCDHQYSVHVRLELRRQGRYQHLGRGGVPSWQACARAGSHTQGRESGDRQECAQVGASVRTGPSGVEDRVLVHVVVVKHGRVVAKLAAVKLIVLIRTALHAPPSCHQDILTRTRSCAGGYQNTIGL